MDEQVEIGLSSIVSKILCKRHNELLSPLDEAGAASFSTLREITRLENKREHLKRRMWNVIRYKINGSMLERWFIKTAINIVCAQNQEVTWRESKTPRLEPPSAVVEAVFGNRKIPPDMGLFCAANAGQEVVLSSHITFAPLLLDRAVCAAIFEFSGFRFVISLSDGPMPDQPPFLKNLSEGWQEAGLQYHLKRVRFKIDGCLSHDLTLTWPPFGPRTSLYHKISKRGVDKLS